jgi:hypothetical protein
LHFQDAVSLRLHFRIVLVHSCKLSLLLLLIDLFASTITIAVRQALSLRPLAHGIISPVHTVLITYLITNTAVWIRLLASLIAFLIGRPDRTGGNPPTRLDPNVGF